ncbi:hypothetical protein ONE63_002605 [Megalurothrips usitatus]|uniref:Uncharacterized protein n=1 Tax=Megalurothrips usitatus TaxID=439358 RepID=A0AAV7XCY5_9NEOP|nr:hypothetical protein ONE63_002605 [Megalurothrips usitatus]
MRKPLRAPAGWTPHRRTTLLRHPASNYCFEAVLPELLAPWRHPRGPRGSPGRTHRAATSLTPPAPPVTVGGGAAGAAGRLAAGRVAARARVARPARGGRSRGRAGRPGRRAAAGPVLRGARRPRRHTRRPRRAAARRRRPQRPQPWLPVRDPRPGPQPGRQHRVPGEPQGRGRRRALPCAGQQGAAHQGEWVAEGGAARAAPRRPARVTPCLGPQTPPVQTIRNYSKVNDDGSFTFGYEAADGSFKEETRGTDCVVRGKYGYVDPDGNKREFTYVSGNPCDPNAVQEEEPQPGAKDVEADSGEENIPANFPSRSLRPTLARPAKPTTTLFQQSYSQDSEEDVDDEDLPPAPVPVRARARPTPRPTTTLYQSTASPSAPTPQAAVRITPRPYSSTTTPEPPATTYRPQAQAAQVSVTPRPVAYPKPYSPLSAAPIRSSTPGTIDFSEELRKFQLDNNVVATTERPGAGVPAKSSDPIYSTELVFDPASGQYNTVVYQSLPKSQDINAVQRHRLQPYVAPQQQHLPQHLQHHQQQQAQLQPGSLYQQQLVQQQQATLLQQSQQLFAQQQRQLQQQRSLAAASAYQAPRYQPGQLQQVSSTAAPVKLAPAPSRYIAPQPVQYAPASGHSGPPQTQFYYVSPQDAGDQRAALAAGQIDAFLRGHNLSF